MFKKTLVASLIGIAAVGAQAADLDGFFVVGGLSTSSASDSVTSAGATETGKTFNLGVGYAMPILDGKAQVAVVGETVISIGGSSTKSVGVSVQPGYYLSDDVVVYGKLGVVSESRSDASLNGTTVGLGVKVKVSQSSYVAGEIEQVKFSAPSNSKVEYNLKDTRVSAKIGFLF